MILCFDIGGTAIKCAEAFGPTDIRPQSRIATPSGDFAMFVSVLRQAVLAASQPPQRLAFSIAGAIDPETGVAQVANIACLSGRRLQADLQEALGLPVDLANDADCFALAEAALGAGRGHAVVFGIILGTGIGGALVVRGQVIGAGEWGHGPIAQRLLGQPEVTLPAFACGCGQHGCLETLGSARGLERLHLHLHQADRSSEVIVTDWQAGDPAARRTIEIWLDLLSAPLAMLQNLLAAGVIVAGGGLSKTPALIAALDQAVQSRILHTLPRPLVVPSTGDIEPGLIGAALLGLSRLGA